MDRLSRLEYSKLTDEEKRQRKLKSKKLWNDKNKEYQQKYRLDNKTKISEQQKIWIENNMEHKKEQDKQYHKNNPKNQYQVCKTNWRARGVDDKYNDNYKTLYEYYVSVNNCEDCNCILSDDKIRTSISKCLDHDHNTGLFRNVVCHTCNVKRK